jgi:hypothetical protein
MRRSYTVLCVPFGLRYCLAYIRSGALQLSAPYAFVLQYDLLAKRRLPDALP